MLLFWFRIERRILHWFKKNHKVLDLDIDLKTEFIQNNPLKKEDQCCLCDFPIDPRVKKWMARALF